MSLVIGALLEVAAVLLLLASISASVIVVVLLFLLVWPGEGGRAVVPTLLAALANAMLYAIVWGLHRAGRRCIESAARHDPSRDLGRIWDRVYGGALILFGITLGLFVAHEIFTPQTESLLMLVTRLSIASFVAAGAVAIGFERITRRELGTIEKLVKPDDWLIERFGPKGSHWTGGKKTPDDQGASDR